MKTPSGSSRGSEAVASFASLLTSAATPLAPSASVPQLQPMRVLVVEDDAKIASFVVRGLKQAGYAVDHAPDGETGLALAESTDYDPLIVDVMLPKLDGISLVKRLRAARRPTPI